MLTRKSSPIQSLEGFKVGHPQAPRRATPGVPIWHRNWLSLHSLNNSIRSCAPRLHGGIFLDLGCGNKPYRPWFSQASLYFGIDIVGTNNTADVVAEGRFLPLASESLDCVLCFQVLEHVEEPLALLAEVRRTLKRGQGWLLLSAPMTWPHHEAPYDFYRYTRFGLDYLLRKAGFEIISIGQPTGNWSVVGQTLAHTLSESIRRPIFFPMKIAMLLTTNLLFWALDRLNYNAAISCDLVVLARV